MFDLLIHAKKNDLTKTVHAIQNSWANLKYSKYLYQTLKPSFDASYTTQLPYFYHFCALTSRITINTAFQTILPFQEHKRGLMSPVIQYVSRCLFCRLKGQNLFNEINVFHIFIPTKLVSFII